MKIPNFLEKILYVKPFIKQVNGICVKNYCLYYITSSDNKDLEIFLIINNKMLEISRKFGEETISKIWDISADGLEQWEDKKRKILLLKKEAQISHPKEVIEKLTYQINIQKKYIEINSLQTREIFNKIVFFEKPYYENNNIDVNVNINRGTENQWLD